MGNSKVRFFKLSFVFLAIVGVTVFVSGNPFVISELENREDDPSLTLTVEPFFEINVLPILKENCLRCHDPQIRMAGLDVSSRSGIFEGSSSGRVLVAGKPEESRLLEVIEKGLMPADGQTKLTGDELQKIRRWIEMLDASENTDRKFGVPQVSQEEIIPLMLLHCTVCHGKHLKEGDLDLRNRASMLKGGKSGPAIVVGQPEKSLILKMVKKGSMPPKEREVEASVRAMSNSEIDLLEAWISQGAPKLDTNSSVGSPNKGLSREEQRFWAFTPSLDVKIPQPKNIGGGQVIRNPIDAFIAVKLEEQGLRLSVETDALSLMRRAYFDLTGLPPTPDEVTNFIMDRAPDAYERMVERLLESSRYGERWGRYWLDLVGYQDWPEAYRYRDYVIRSLNQDKSYDRFIQEQIAGDELADYEGAPVITQEIMDNLVATGFLRMAPDYTGNRLTNFVSDRIQVISDEISVLSSSVMGLTMQCAKCHDHKFDPITQRDYYRLTAIFKGAFDEHDWLPPYRQDAPNRPLLASEYRVLPYVNPLSNPLRLDRERLERQTANARLEKEISSHRAVLKEKAKPLRKRILNARLAKIPAVLRGDIRKMLTTSPKDRTEFQEYLADKFEEDMKIQPEELTVADANYAKSAEEIEKRIKVLQSKVYSEPQIRGLWDRGEPSPTYLLRRGDPMSPGRWVKAGVPFVFNDIGIPFEVKPPWPGTYKTGRRLAFAKWLTHPKHPLTSRVMVNRIWKHHFGKGIVRTLENFGHAGARPTHSNLLDWLANEFIRLGWSMKAMHRLIMTSSTYRQSSVVNVTQSRIDPDNLFLSRMPMRRMEAEVLRDTLFLVSGRLDERQYGPPDPVYERQDGLVTSLSNGQGWRRSIYVEQHTQHKRGGKIPTILQKFDFPQMNPNCVERTESTVVPQALHLLNNKLVRDLSESFAGRVKKEAGEDIRSQIRRAYLILLSRPPKTGEMEVSLEFLSKLKLVKQRLDQSKTKNDVLPLVKFCHSLMNTAAFLYID